MNLDETDAADPREDLSPLKWDAAGGTAAQSLETTRATPDDLLLGKIALEWNLIEAGQLEQCLRDQRESRSQGRPRFLGEVLIEKGLIKPDQLPRLLHEQNLRAEGVPIIPRYPIRERLGEGATAIVYRAWDRDLNRPVALKVLRESAGISDLAKHRFRREAQAEAGLAHPNLVTVYDAGEAGGRLYLVMELVEGRPLTEALKDPAASLEDRLRLLEKSARGVAAAHAKGIIHRDLKPANIILSASGEPKVGDFGLAHMVDSSTELTVTGSTLGTPLYMSPEQVEGRTKDLSPATDVYALGAMLYEILVGRTPHRGENAMEIYSKIVHDEPEAPRKLNSKLSQDLETIVLKALDKEPTRRYGTAETFAEDLRRFLAGDAIAARPLPHAVRLWRKGMKRRTVLIPLAVATLLLLATWGISAARRSMKIGEALAGGLAREKQGDLEAARLSFRSVLDLDADHPEALRALERTEAELTRRRELHAEAIKLLETSRPALDAAFRSLFKKDSKPEDFSRRIDAAEKMIQDAIGRAPRVALGHYLLGKARSLKGRDAPAEESLRTALELDPEFAPAHYELGRLLLERSYRASIGVSPEERESNRPRAELLVREAAEELKKAIRKDGGLEAEADRELAGAMMAHAGGDAAGAFQRAKAGSEKFAGTEGVEDFHWLMGLSTQSTSERIDAFTRALEIRPKYPLVLFCRAAARRAVGNFDGAIADCNEALLTHPLLVEAINNRGAARYEKGDYDPAIADFEEALRIDPNYRPAYTNRGTARARKGDLEGAIVDFTEALRREPRDLLALRNRALARSTRGETDGAIEDLSAALAINPLAEELLNDRGVLRARKGNLAEAIADYDEALKLTPAWAKPYNNRGSARLGRGEFDGALSDFTEAVRLSPGFSEAWYNRGIARARKGDLVPAIADLGKAIEINADYAAAYCERGILRAENGDLKGADADLTKAIQLRPAWGAPRISRAELREARGDNDGAAQDARKALELDLSVEERKVLEELLRKLDRK